MSAPVVIDARAAVRAEIGGVERVARELCERLPVLAPGRYEVARPPAPLAHRAGHVWEQFALPLRARAAQLLLCPANLAPLASDRNVVLIHDAAPLRNPSWFSPGYARYQRRLLPALARRARRVVTVSEFSRRQLAELIDVPADEIAVVPNGVGERFTPDADPAPARAALELERPYVLALGTPGARKNLGALGTAAELLEREGIELVTAGAGRGYLPAEPPPGRALGYVPDEHLPGLYAGALACALPSLYEGFGLPCLEAMASGVPVVAASRGALPETCGDAALLVDPEDHEALALAVLEAATDPATRSRLSAAGPTRAAGFDWNESAKRLDTVISELLAA